jgi:hypothetical protein
MSGYLFIYNQNHVSAIFHCLVDGGSKGIVKFSIIDLVG